MNQGPSIEISGLLAIIRELNTSLICVSLTLASYVDTLTELGKKVHELPSPRPVFVFGGQAFEKHKEFIDHVPGIYVDGDINSIVTQLRSLVDE